MPAPNARKDVDILEVMDKLVSPYTGLVRKFQRVYKDVAEPAAPFIWRAEVANHRYLAKLGDNPLIASGKGFEAPDAMRSTLGEAVERYCAWRFESERCRVAARRDLDGVVLEPENLVLHSDEQLERLPYARYSPDLPIAWIEGRRLTDGAAAWCPASAVYLVPPTDTPVFFQSTSNGLAAGASADQAQLKAILELIERDAFLAAWYHRLPLVPIDARTHSDKRVAGLIDAYARRGVEISLLLVPTDHGIPVVIGLATEEAEGGVAAVVGLGADRSLANAVRSALLEVGQIRPAIRMKLRDPEVLRRREELVNDPSLVAELEDHDLLYTDKRMLRAFAEWRNPSRSPMPIGQKNRSGRTDLDFIVGRLRSTGSETFVCDVTTKDIASLGLHVARAFIEDFQPIHFGESEFRAGGRRFYDLPARLGVGGHASGRGLNPLPHPLA